MRPTDITAPQDWSFPIPIAYGPGRLSEIGARCLNAGMRRPLIVTDRGSRDLPFIARLVDVLTSAGLESAVFSEIAPNPRDVDIALGRTAFQDGGHDGVVAIGGGSAMDGGKAIGLVAQSGVDLWDFEYERPSPAVTGPSAFPPLVTIPTTAGTGAETESTAMVTDTAQGMKFCVWHPAYKPTCALLDPELTIGLPRNLTAWTGVDALTHAIEAYVVPGFHPLCDGAALEGLRLINEWLPVAVDTPTSVEARGGMLTGSCLAGVAFLKGLGHVHAISHMIGAEYDIHHGLLNAVLLPPVLRFNAPAMAPHAGPLCDAMGLVDRSADGLHSAVCDVLDRLEIPTSLGALGVPTDCAARIAAKALRDSAAGTNPRPATLPEMTALVSEAIVGAR